MEACVIVTYRCNARCHMCGTWRHPSAKEREITADDLEKRIPGDLSFVNITGGEPLLREDIHQIVRVLIGKSKRLVISTNGYFSERIIRLAEDFGNKIGFRISIEGFPSVNDKLRGIKDGFDHGLRSIVELCEMGISDVGFGITVSDKNAKDMMELWRLSKLMRLEFATAVTHNSFYFHISNNRFYDPEGIAREFQSLATELLRSPRPKNWFRAYFNMGLANKVRGGKRPLPCEAGTDVFFLDPYGNVMPCNGSDLPMIMGNIFAKSFHDIWNGEDADEIRKVVKECPKQCWMIGSASPAMKKRFWVPALWIARNRFRLFSERNRATCLTHVGNILQ